MASIAPTFGVPRVALSQVDTATTLDDLNTLTSNLSVTALAWTDIRQNSPKNQLSGTYNVKIVEVGYDVVNQGFTFGRSTPDSVGSVTVTSGEGILVHIANGNFPTYMSHAIAIGILIQKGQGPYFMANFGYMDPSNDFSYLVTGEPLLSAFNLTGAELDANTVLDQGGSRSPKGILYSKNFRTVGGVKINHRTESVHVDQDDAPAYDDPVARAGDLEFAVLSNNLNDLVQLSAGDYVQYIDTNGNTVQLGDTEIMATISQLKGNKAIKVLYPPNKSGQQVTKLVMGNIDISNAEWVENYQKLEQFRLDQRLVTAPIDDITAACGTGISYVRIP